MDRNGEAALITMTAFHGAVVGLTGCLAGALQADVIFMGVAAAGSIVCICIWYTNLESV